MFQKLLAAWGISNYLIVCKELIFSNYAEYKEHKWVSQIWHMKRSTYEITSTKIFHPYGIPSLLK